MFRSLKFSLNELLNNKEIKKSFNQGKIENVWHSSVGQSISNNTTVLNFKNNILLIKADTPVWRNELTFQKADILNKLNEKLEGITIKDIRFL